MATNRSETANFLVFNFYGWCKLSKPNQQNGPGTSPLPIGRVGGTVRTSGQLTYNNNIVREIIEKNVTTFGHLCVTDTLGRTTLNLKTFEEIKDE